MSVSRFTPVVANVEPPMTPTGSAKDRSDCTYSVFTGTGPSPNPLARMALLNTDSSTRGQKYRARNHAATMTDPKTMRCSSFMAGSHSLGDRWHGIPAVEDDPAGEVDP